MAEVFIAAAPGEDAQARGLAEALATVGFDTGSATPVETEIAKLAEEAKAVVVLWARGAPPPWLAMLSTLALDRKKFISVELRRDATPALFKEAPKFDFATRDRTAFKESFEKLIAEIGKVSTAKTEGVGQLADAVIKLRTAILNPAQPGGGSPWRRVATFGVAVGALFAVGFGAGRIINAIRSGEMFVMTPSADASPTSAPATTPAPQQDAANAPFGFTQAELQQQNWRESAEKINEPLAARIKAAANGGDAFAQALACLGHMTGAEGFLPSPSAAREQCDASSEKRNPAGLYFSWALSRAAPHAGITDATARTRLAEAAGMGWTPALIDYGLALAPDARAPVADQAEAGRLWLAAAERGDARGQFQYARWLRDSAAGPRDPAAAIPFLERAANSGQLDATHMLATLYRDGIGAPRNEGRARALYEQAARANHPPSMFNLADMLRGGSAEDRARAIVLYRSLACMRDEVQISALAGRRLRALRESAPCR